MIGGAFEVVRAAGSVPARMPGAEAGADNGRIIDQYEWLQLTLGRFLAPVRDGNNGIEYLLLGSVDESQLTRRDVEAEVNEFRQSIAKIGKHLAEQIASKELVRSQVLVSLQAMLELRLPDPADSTAFHLRGGMLQIAKWGLGGGISLSDLIADVTGRRPGAAGGSYFDRLTATLVSTHRAQSVAPGRAPSGNGHSDYQPPMPPALAAPPAPEHAVSTPAPEDIPRPATNESIERNMAMAFRRELDPADDATAGASDARPSKGLPIKAMLERMPWWHLLYAALGLVLGFLIHAVFFCMSGK